jgi:hypothetical protein
MSFQVCNMISWVCNIIWMFRWSLVGLVMQIFFHWSITLCMFIFLSFSLVCDGYIVVENAEYLLIELEGRYPFSPSMHLASFTHNTGFKRGLRHPSKNILQSWSNIMQVLMWFVLWNQVVRKLTCLKCR